MINDGLRQTNTRRIPLPVNRNTVSNDGYPIYGLKVVVRTISVTIVTAREMNLVSLMLLLKRTFAKSDEGRNGWRELKYSPAQTHFSQNPLSA